MKKFYSNIVRKFSLCFKVMMLLGMMGVGVKGWGQGTENFNNIAATTTYDSRTWTGFNAQSWNATDAREDQTITGKAITIRNGVLTFGLTAAQLSAGIGSLTISAKAPFGSPDVGVLNLFVNGTSVGTKTTTGATTTSVVSYTWSNINIATLTSLTISQTTSGSRITIDDISWTASCIGPSNPANPTVTGTNPSCGATSLNTIVPPGGETYYWQGTSALGTSTANPSSATFPISVSGTFYVRSQNASGCWSAGSGSLVVTINNPVSITTQPTTTNQVVCSGSALTSLNVLAIGTSLAYQWYSNAISSNSGGTLIGSATSATYAPSNTLLGTTYYYCIVSGAAPCTSVTSNVSGGITVNTLPINPAGAISGTTPACGSSVLTYSTASANEYWQTSATGTITANPTTVGLTISTSGNYYVRAYNGTCWSASATAAYPVIINSSPNITVQPSNQTVSTPTAATFSVTAGNAFGYQWQVNTGSGFANVSTGVGGTTATYTTAATTTGMNGNLYKCIVNGIAPCGDITSAPATLTVSTGPCLNEGFAAGTSAPSGWTFTSIGGTYTSAGNYGLASPSLQFDATSDRVQTSTITSASQLSFWIKGQGSTGSSFLVEGFSGAWLTIENITSIPTTGTTYTYNSSTTPSLPTNITQFRFTYTRSLGNVSFDDVKVFCNAACPPTTTIASLIPATGPINTRVTITGTGFTNTSIVKFGSVTAASTFVNATTIIALVPYGVSTSSDVIVSNASGCYSTPFTGFTLISTTGSCGISDLIISEIYDPASGNNHYIEIYNGTLNVINLDAPDYELSVVNNPGNNITTWNISGTIAPGQVIVYYAGSNGGSANGTQATAGTGFNDGFDEIRLLKNGVILDRVIAPDEIGYTIKRNTTVTSPNAVYTASEWTVLSNESTVDITYFNVTSPIAFPTNPADQICAFSMNVTTSGSPSSYQWKYYNSNTGTWDAFNNGAATVLAPAFVAGATTATLNITGDISNLYKYQFYCEISKSGCTNASYAAEFSYNTKSYYRSNVATGNWTTPASWLMSDDNITYVATCTYPIAKNSDKVIIQNGHKITFAVNSLFLDESNVTIQSGGEFELGTSAQMRFLNKQVGADFIINGTFTDRSSSSNGIYFETNATWTLGASATIIKTNSASVNVYQATYEGGISTIPATANWIFRYNLDGAVAVTTTQMYYPNLTFESISGLHNATGLSESFNGSVGGFATVKGNLDIGGTQGLGTYTLYNENTNTQAMLILGNLTVRTGSTLNNGASPYGTGFEVKGNLTIDGIFNVNAGNTGTLTLSGTAVQTIAGSNVVADNMNVQNCIMTNTIGITENKDFNIFGTHTFGANSKLDFGTGIISLKSNLSKTANVAPFPTSASITYTFAGRFSVERYLFGQKAWRFLASPVQLVAQDAGTATIAATWREGQSALTSTGYGTAITWKQGSTFGPADELDYYTQRGSMKYYYDVNNEWIELSNTTATKIANTQGYMLFVRGDRGAPNTLAGVGTATNMRIKGKIRTGDQTFAVLAGSAAITKFQSIGNPYPSQIKFGTIFTNSTAITNSFVVWNPKLPGLYGVGGYENYIEIGAGIYTLNGQAQTAFNVRNTIESGEAFFVQNSTTAVGSVIIKEIDKGLLSNTVSRGAGSGVVKPTLDISLFEKDSIGNYVYGDGSSTSFDNSFSTGIDNNDVVKFTNTNDNLFIQSNNKNLVVERRPIPTESDTIKLGLTGTRVAAYRLQIDPYLFNNISVAPFLIDKYLQTTTALSIEDSTNYNFNITAVAASKAADRFMIVFKQAAINFTTIAAIRNADKTITINWGVANEKNINNYSIEQSNDGTNFTTLSTQTAIANNGKNPNYSKLDATASKATNWYKIKINNTNGTVKYSSIAMVAAVKEEVIIAAESIAIEPNIITNGNINLHLKNKPTGKYIVQVYNTVGQKTLAINLQVNTNNEIKVIQLGNITKGKYAALIEDEKGNKTTLDFVVN